MVYVCKKIQKSNLKMKKQENSAGSIKNGFWGENFYQ
jgi:hypothetical protein